MSWGCSKHPEHAKATAWGGEVQDQTNFFPFMLLFFSSHTQCNSCNNMGQPHISPLMRRGHSTSSQASAPTAHSANPTSGHVQTPLLPPVQASDQGTIQTPQHHPAGLLCSSKLGLVALHVSSYLPAQHGHDAAVERQHIPLPFRRENIYKVLHSPEKAALKKQSQEKGPCASLLCK